VEGLDVTTGIDPTFWRGRRVLLTGHTGFKGSWAALMLGRAGAAVTGLALPSDTDPALFNLAGVAGDLDHRVADIRDRSAVAEVVAAARPEIVLHMAAQAIVRRAVYEPVETIAINTMGTANLLEALRSAPSLKAVVVATTDKVYANPESGRRFVESDPLGGDEPYSASKAAAEFIVRAYAETFFERHGIAVATARGGNVLGGGDFGEDRLVPDVVRAVSAGTTPLLRNPESTRPWQHVLDCLSGYLRYAEALVERRDVPRALNFGPSGEEIRVRAVADAMLVAIGARPAWTRDPTVGPRESERLQIDSSAARRTLGWRDRLTSAEAIEWTAAWHKAHRSGEDMRAFSLAQIEAYEALAQPAEAAVVGRGR
jgi:CDP-glucose 4,6-dehydratase